MTTLGTREAYRLWAPSYAAETTISFLENDVVTRLAVPTENLRLLDAGCGIGRRMASSGAAFSVGVDVSAEMLAQAKGSAPLITASVNALPLRGSLFDVVWCRLVLGHLPDIATAYKELANACTAGGHVVMTDFHADGVARGHRRTFRDEQGAIREVEHYVHDANAHIAAATAAGLTVTARADGVVGPNVQEFYERAGKREQYHKQLGLPLILAIVFRKNAA